MRNHRKYILTFLFFLTCLSVFSQKKQEKEYISNYEYRQFTSWVRDSISREILGIKGNDDYRIYLSEKHWDHVINWEPRIKWNDKKNIDKLYEMFIPLHERYYRKKEIDYRKLNYKYNKEIINIYPDTLVWIDTATKQIKLDGFVDEYISDGVRTNLTNHYFTHPYFNDYPVQGLNKEQIDAFLNWKKYNSKIQYSENKFKNLDSIKILVDTKFWKITNEDYNEFINWVTDSLIRQVLGDEEDYERYFIHEDKFGNYFEPPLINWKTRIPYKTPDIIGILSSIRSDSAKYRGPKGVDKRKIRYVFYELDLIKGAKPENKKQGLVDRSVMIYKHVTLVYPDTTLLSKNYNPSIEEKFDKKEYANLPIESINYYMAKAYYHWYIEKIAKEIKANKNPLCYYVIPNIEEWKDIISKNNYEPFYKYIKIPTINYYP